MALETIVDNLRDGLKQLEPGSLVHVDELRAEQTENHALRNQWNYTADGNGYRVNGDDIEWGLTRGKDSPIMQDIDDASGQLIDPQRRIFRPSQEISDAAFNAPDTLVTPLSQLRYQIEKEQKEGVYLQVRTSDGFVLTGYDAKDQEIYEAPRDVESAVFVRTGLTEQFRKELNDAGVKTTRTYFPNPDYIQKEIAKDSEQKPIWRASRLNSFGYYSSFNADNRNVNLHYALRGVRRGVREADAPESEEVPRVPSAPQEMTHAQRYDALLADRPGAVQALDDVRAAGLSQLLTDYLATKV